jgi:hypothetical protein
MGGYRWQLASALPALQDIVQPAVTVLSEPQVLADLSQSFHDFIAAQPSYTTTTEQQQQQQWGRNNSLAVQLALVNMSAGLRTAGAALCAALPNRYFCNNPACGNAAGVSAGFGLVRGAACVCGGCVGAERAAGVAVAAR